MAAVHVLRGDVRAARQLGGMIRLRVGPAEVVAGAFAAVVVGPVAVVAWHFWLAEGDAVEHRVGGRAGAGGLTGPGVRALGEPVGAVLRAVGPVGFLLLLAGHRLVDLAGDGVAQRGQRALHQLDVAPYLGRRCRKERSSKALA